jgi:glyoxylase I family protein
MTAQALHHAATTVTDMEASLRFYRDVMGFKVVDDDVLEGPDISKMVGLPDVKLRAVMLSADDDVPFLELIQYLRPQSRALRSQATAADIGTAHFCFLVESIHEEYERLTGLGVRFNAPPFVAEGGRFDGEWAAYCFDPDGLIVELWSRGP